MICPDPSAEHSVSRPALFPAAIWPACGRRAVYAELPHLLGLPFTRKYMLDRNA